MDQELPVFTSALSYEAVTVSSTSKALTLTKYRAVSAGGQTHMNARIAFITLDGAIETNVIRWTVDGTAPVASTTGHVLQPGQTLVIRGFGNIVNFRAIRDLSTDCKLQVTYFV